MVLAHLQVPDQFLLFQWREGLVIRLVLELLQDLVAGKHLLPKALPLLGRSGGSPNESYDFRRQLDNGNDGSRGAERIHPVYIVSRGRLLIRLREINLARVADVNR